MASMIVQQKVKDFESWKKVYDSVAGLRSFRGALSEQIFREASDPNNLFIVFKWNSLENAERFAQSPELKAAMARAGVDGQPKFYFLTEA
jgi:heme-degrading monooxygenase HmoA